MNQLMDLGIVYNGRAVRATIEALFAFHGVPYGAAPPVVPDVGDVEITTQDEPPIRPDDSPT